ncbi:MAG: hypothetical protein F2534_01085 [Actinobacteria bacterium]|jgi:hypothetical protein|nr:hypothetical protein [Actinomycetota bacterium]
MARSVGCIDQTVRLKSSFFSADGSTMLAAPEAGCRCYVTSGSNLLTLRRPQQSDNFTLFLALTLSPYYDEQLGVWRVTTLRYDYEMSQAGRLRFGWHWHPYSRKSTVKWPHMHLPEGTPFANKHLPSGRIALEEILLFALDQLKVEPAHANAEQVLTDVMQRHKLHRAWH